MVGLTRVLLFLYGIALIGGGVMGYVKAQSQASLIAGGISGFLALVAATISLSRPRLGFGIGIAVAAALAYERFKHYLEVKEGASGNVPLMIAVASAFMVLVCLVGLAAARPRRE
jgi:uncharacterized membrane protein (UPF0136 family)